MHGELIELVVNNEQGNHLLSIMVVVNISYLEVVVNDVHYGVKKVMQVIILNKIEEMVVLIYLL